MLIYWIRNDFRFIDNEALNYFSNYDGKKYVFTPMMKTNLRKDLHKNGGFINL